VKYFGVGNESWDCGGSMRPEYYADQFRRYNTFVKNYDREKPIYRIACGAYGEDYNWTEVLMKQAGRQMSGLSLHYYTIPSGVWGKGTKGRATGFGEDQWHSTLRRTLRMDELIARHAAIMNVHDPQKRVGLVIDEWGTWYDVEPDTNEHFLYQQSTLRDALVAALNFHVFHKHADRVVMANIAQTINVLQAVILTEREKMIVTPTYHVFEMFKIHQGAASLRVDLTTPDHALGAEKIPAVSASASRDSSGKVHLSLANTHPRAAAGLTCTIAGMAAKSVYARVLTAPAIDSHNTFAAPDAVAPKPLEGAKLSGDTLTVTLPAKSVVVLAIQ
jgi:alpha-N-arabinofuranosidase